MRHSAFEIWLVTQEEWDAVLEVCRQCEDFLALGPEPTASMAMVTKDIELSQSEGGCFCGIYTLAGQMMGIVDYVPRNFQGERHTASLSLLMIAAPFRGRGLGTAVVELVEGEILKDAEVTTILSGVQVNNPRAVRFWQKRDYQIVSGPERTPDLTTVFRLRKDFGLQAQTPQAGGSTRDC